MMIKTIYAIIIAWLIVVVGGCLLAEVNERATKHDDFVQRFVEDFKDSPVVKFDNGQLKLWAKMSDEERRNWIIGTLATLLPGVVCLGGSFFVKRTDNQIFLIVMGALLLVSSGIVALCWERRAEKEHVRCPCLVLDDAGISSLKGRKISWQDIGNITLRALDFFNEWGTKVSEVRVLSFLDKYNNVVIQFDKSDMLPISIDNVYALAEHLFNKFKETQNRQQGQPAAMPAV